MLKIIGLALVVFLACVGAAEAAFTVKLTWADNSNNEDGFIVERAADKAAAFSEIGRVLANVVTYDDATPAGGNCYRVGAFNISGVAYSNVACLPTAPAAPGTPSFSFTVTFP